MADRIPAFTSILGAHAPGGGTGVGVIVMMLEPLTLALALVPLKLVVLVVNAVDNGAASYSSSVSSSTIIRLRLPNVAEDVPKMGGKSLLIVPLW